MILLEDNPRITTLNRDYYVYKSVFVRDNPGMPSINRIKVYLPGAFYHIYNRGVAKQEIFSSDEDYLFFLNKVGLVKKDDVEIIAHCLMKNHFHLLIQNNKERGIEHFMRSLGTSYSQYFNRKYGRVGHLFQESYKARMLKTDNDISNVIRYIHENPYEDNPDEKSVYPYSSEQNYLLIEDNPVLPLTLLTPSPNHVNYP